MTDLAKGILTFYFLQGCENESYRLKEWKKMPGDSIESPAVIAVIEAETFTVDVEYFHNGTLKTLNYQVGEPISDGSILATFE